MSTLRQAFDRGAGRYDLMVGLNPGYHAELRRAAQALAQRLRGRSRPLRVLDIACGSGASTRALVDAAPHDTEVLGVDASTGMLDQARAKAWPARVRFEEATAGELDLDRLGRDSWDGILTAYLFRNVPAERRDAAAAEAFDLLAPGGWLVVQEYSVAGRRRAGLVWNLVCWAVIIPLGFVVDRNPGLYRYLWRSVLAFDTTATFADRLARAGFVSIARRDAHGWQRGILHTFVAQRPVTASESQQAVIR